VQSFILSLLFSIQPNCGFVRRSTRTLIDEAQEQPKTNAPLVKLHGKLVTVLWIIMGLEMKSVKPLSLFDTKVIISIN